MSSIFSGNAKAQKNIFYKCTKEMFTGFKAEIFYLAKELFKSGEAVDNVIMALCFEKKEHQEYIYNTAINYVTCTTDDIYIKKLSDRYINRLIREAKNKEDLENIKTIRDELEAKDSNIVHISSGVEDFEEIYQESTGSIIKTGFKKIDDIIGSFNGGDYIALGGSTGSGKTSIALNIVNSISSQGKNVLYASLEMPLSQMKL